MAPNIEAASDVVVERLDVQPGHDVLDVATGNGNAALVAARRGARVTGVDFVPKLVEAAKERAAREGAEATFLVGDAQALPFEDDSFDRVCSVFGAMFAPDQEKAAAELVRVCRPGGRIAVAAWTPEGVNGRFFMALAKHLPPPPEGFKPPLLWGTEARVEELFAGHDIRTERLIVSLEAPSLEEYATQLHSNLGPIVMARAVLEPEGKWEAAEADLMALYRETNQATDGSLRDDAEYLLTTVTVR